MTYKLEIMHGIYGISASDKVHPLHVSVIHETVPMVHELHVPLWSVINDQSLEFAGAILFDESPHQYPKDTETYRFIFTQAGSVYFIKKALKSFNPAEFNIDQIGERQLIGTLKGPGSESKSSPLCSPDFWYFVSTLAPPDDETPPCHYRYITPACGPLGDIANRFHATMELISFFIRRGFIERLKTGTFHKFPLRLMPFELQYAPLKNE